MAQITAQDQLMLELLNKTRANPQAEANRLLSGNLNKDLAPGTISNSAKQPLAFNSKLFNAARDHSQWMLNTNNFSHTGAGGSQPWDRATAAGYDWTRSGENIAWRGTTGNLDFNSSVIANEEGLFQSSGHRKNILNDGYREIGISNLSGNFKGYNAAMTTQLFGTGRSNNSFLTGVVYTDAVKNDNFYSIGEGLGNVTVKAVGNGQTFSAKTINAGGYQLQLAPGSYSVSFEGDFDGDGKLDKTAARNVSLGNKNVKVDFSTDTFKPTPISNPSQPAPTPSLGKFVSQLKLNETSGKAAKDSSTGGGNNPGMLKGNAAFVKNGKNKGGVRLDGKGDLIAIANSKDINLGTHNDRTVSLWFKLDKGSTNQPKVLYEEGGSIRGLNMYIDKNKAGQDRLRVGGWNTPGKESGWTGTWLSTNKISTGQWHHVALVLEGGNSVAQNALRGYLDGELFGSGKGSKLWSHSGGIGVGSINGGTRFAGGKTPGSGYGFDGMVDEVMISNNALNADQIEAMV